MTKKKHKKNIKSIENVSATLKRQEDCWMRINSGGNHVYEGLPSHEDILTLYHEGSGPLSIAVKLQTRAKYVKAVLAHYYPEKHEHNADDWRLPDNFI